jgi:hypothetical protein
MMCLRHAIAKVKHLVANLSLDRHILQEIVQKKDTERHSNRLFGVHLVMCELGAASVIPWCFRASARKARTANLLQIAAQARQRDRQQIVTFARALRSFRPVRLGRIFRTPSHPCCMRAPRAGQQHRPPAPPPFLLAASVHHHGFPVALALPD